MTRRVLLAFTSALLAACGSAAPPSNEAEPSERTAYLTDASARRSELEASLVNPSNGYSTLRLEHYATGADGDWERLAEWNPAVAPIGSAELGVAAAATLADDASALALPADPVHATDGELLALGKAAFERYPVQLAPYFAVALASADAAGSYGLWLDDARGVGGLVRVQMADGSTSLAVTCSTCHASPGASGVEDGLPNASLDLGAALIASGTGLGGASVDAVKAWGPGRLDVTTATGLEPVRISDLRPSRFLTYLQQDATLATRDVTTLAIRIETLAITSSGQVLRPPRVVAWALALYLETLADALPAESSARTASPQGAELFDAQCSSCHAAPGLTGPPVPLAVVGTDPTLGLSTDRGTGTYRVPSLHGVGTRGPLLHDASVASVDALFDPARPTPAFSGRLHGSGAVAGHPFGLDFTADERAALLAYLHAL
ncbi:MAG TPA: hypothetical protein VMI54_23745 [Polyangiaceae bacterium]|nr:hypothetical protein [Polyangiaceae bacterium]